MTTAAEVSPEVLYATEAVTAVSIRDVHALQDRALRAPRRRSRICMHLTVEERVHEMIIALASDSYVRPHRHIGKAESVHVLAGEAVALFFDDHGNVDRVIRIGAIDSGQTFYYRIAAPIFHSLIVLTEQFVFHEVVEGPFNRGETEFPSWAPSEDEPSKIMAYRQQLETASRATLHANK